MTADITSLQRVDTLSKDVRVVAKLRHVIIRPYAQNQDRLK